MFKCWLAHRGQLLRAGVGGPLRNFGDQPAPIVIDRPSIWQHAPRLPDLQAVFVASWHSCGNSLENGSIRTSSTILASRLARIFELHFLAKPLAAGISLCA